MTGPVVIKLGGRAVESPLHTPDLWRAVAAMHEACAGGVVLVHGGGVLVDAHLARLGMETRRIQGLRVTPPEQMDEIVGVLAGRVNKAIVGALHALTGPHVRAVGLCLGDGRLCPLRITRGPADEDLGRVGVPLITGPADPAHLLRVLCGAGFMPVVCSTGHDEHGEALNVNADDAAAALACLLDASMLVLLTDVPGIRDARGYVLERVSPAQIETMIADGTIAGGMIPKAQAAARAARQTGIPAIVASWHDPATLARLARGETVGTRVALADAAHPEVSP